MKYKVKVPFQDDMGTINEFIATNSPNESIAENALWQINRMREHDNLEPLKELPAGTTLELIREWPAVTGQSQDEYIAELIEQRNLLRETLKATLPALIRLGDFVGNVDPGGASNQGRINRVKLIQQVNQALNNTED